ncbi:hypothetical protein [Streptomyces sp. NPDC060366]|uniref:hypothetical protein n=1 Tax=Streptomyces sp. NPDC060366 TaxID=3347105 RepID=UPI003656D061
MGVKPSAAASAAATGPADSGNDTTTSTNSGFGMPHALVIVACVVTAAILATLGMSVGDVLVLLAGAGSIGGTVVVLVVTGGRGRVGRFVRAYVSSGN